MLPELSGRGAGDGVLLKEYSSADAIMTMEETTSMLREHGLMPEDLEEEPVEMLR
jgi:hypothetical protein